MREMLFSPGQVYVALSRCTNLDGLVLQSRINRSSLQCDERIIQFAQNKQTSDRLKEELKGSGKSYEKDILLSLYGFKRIINAGKELQNFLIEHQKSFNAESLIWIEKVQDSILAIDSTVEKFHPQLLSFLNPLSLKIRLQPCKKELKLLRIILLTRLMRLFRSYKHLRQ